MDDEASLVDLGKRVLELVDYRVTACSDVLDALELVKSRPSEFDLIITDFSMPKMTGVEFASRVVEVRQDLPIILTTGYAPTPNDGKN